MKSVVAVLEDLFFHVKIADGAKRAGLSVIVVNSEEAALSRLQETPSILVVDLNCAAVDPIALIRVVKDRLPDTRAIGYVSHVQTDLRSRAEAAGYDLVVARSVFSTRITDILGENAR